MSEACRGCDGKKVNVRKDEDNIVISSKTCSRCSGSGTEPGVSKGGKRRFTPKPEEDEQELSMEAQTQAFLRKHGF